MGDFSFGRETRCQLEMRMNVTVKFILHVFPIPFSSPVLLSQDNKVLKKGFRTNKINPFLQKRIILLWIISIFSTHFCPTHLSLN